MPARNSHAAAARTAAVALCFGPDLAAYDFGPAHPMQPDRFDLAVSLARHAGLLADRRLTVLPPSPATDDEIAAVHHEDLIAVVRRLGGRHNRAAADVGARFGFGSDTPVFPRMHDAAALVCGSSVAGARAVARGEALHAFAPAGGLHHALAGRASGFCVYNDCSVAIAALLAEGVERVAYVDVDVHHGDGVQWIHYADPRVMTCSVHESGLYLFPGTGFVAEVGEGEARGTSVNVPLPPLAGTREWLTALREVVVPLVEAFEPQVLVSQDGADSHHGDPLAHVQTTMDVFPAMWREIHELAHRAADGRWLALGGGGYQPYTVVPRAWALLLAEMLDTPLDGDLPAAWREEAERAGGVHVPATYLDDCPPERNAAQASRVRTETARAVDGAREALFPIWGLWG
jgi:acetoin utilization protein AcuC